MTTEWPDAIDDAAFDAAIDAHVTVTQAEFDVALQAWVDAVAAEQARLAEEARRAEEARLAEERRAAEARAAAERAETQRAAAGSAPAPAGGPSAAAWAALRQCESSGNYSIVSASGAYHGAYQFHPDTWNGVAARAGRHDLVGVAPSAAAPADQDAMAYRLYAERGAQPWPHCGRHLR